MDGYKWRHDRDMLNLAKQTYYMMKGPRLKKPPKFEDVLNEFLGKKEKQQQKVNRAVKKKTLDELEKELSMEAEA